MKEQKEHLQAISEIRSMMERSSRCISLSGLSGVFAGIFALIGAYLAHIKIVSIYLNMFLGEESYNSLIIYFLSDALIVLVASVSVGAFLTIRNSKKKGIKVWDSASKRLLINLLIPLAAGGIYCLILLNKGDIGMIAPATLLFYGLALINASKYTFNDIRYLGFCEIILGLAGSVYTGYGLLFWSIGFGLLHIVYGAVMYFKYERS